MEVKMLASEACLKVKRLETFTQNHYIIRDGIFNEKRAVKREIYICGLCYRNNQFFSNRKEIYFSSKFVKESSKRKIFNFYALMLLGF